MAFNKTHRATNGQTMFDLALQLYGSAESVVTMLRENPDLGSVLSDPTGVNVNYAINNDPNQRFFIAKGIVVASKPESYLNSTDGVLEAETGADLVQENGYKILL